MNFCTLLYAVFFCKGRQPYLRMVNLSGTGCWITNNRPRFSAWRRISEKISSNCIKHHSWKIFPILSLRELFGFFLQPPAFAKEDRRKTWSCYALEPPFANKTWFVSWQIATYVICFIHWEILFGQTCISGLQNSGYYKKLRSASGTIKYENNCSNH